MNYKQLLLGKIADRTAIVAVAGLGYVGLPLAVEFAGAGFTVLGLDVDEDKVRDAQRRRQLYRRCPG